MDLEKLSLDELKALQNEVAVAIFNFEKKRKAETLAELEALAHAKGFSLKELLDNSNGKSVKKRSRLNMQTQHTQKILGRAVDVSQSGLSQL